MTVTIIPPVSVEEVEGYQKETQFHRRGVVVYLSEFSDNESCNGTCMAKKRAIPGLDLYDMV